MTTEKEEKTDPCRLIPPTLPNIRWGKRPWKLDEEGATIYDAEGFRVADIRGWGALTGGGGLGLDHDTANEAQLQVGRFIVHTVNNAK